MDKLIEKAKAFFATKNGKITVFSIAGAILLLLIIRASVPTNVNVFANNGDECQNAIRTARKKAKIKNKDKNKDK